MLKNNKFLPVIIVIIVVTVSGGIFAADKWYQHRLYNEFHCDSLYPQITREVIKHSFNNADNVFKARMTGYEFHEGDKIPYGEYKILEIYKGSPSYESFEERLIHKGDAEATGKTNPNLMYDRQIGIEYIFFKKNRPHDDTAKPCRDKIKIYENSSYNDYLLPLVKQLSK